MGTLHERFYEFGPFRVDVVDRLLTRDGRVIPLNVKTFEVLLAFLENQGKVLAKDVLMKIIWPDTFVEEGNLTKGIFLLRKTLGEKPGGGPYIETLPKRGYRLIAEVKRSPGESSGEIVRERRSINFRLPAPRNSFIGREQDLAVVRQRLLVQTVRLLTITGAGGSGKTRLALRVASDLPSEFGGGIHFVSLSSLVDPQALGSAIAHSFGLHHTRGKFLPEIVQEHLSLSVQAPTLLLLDNFEHLLSAAPVVGELLDACPLLKILVTSRVVLRVYGEHEYALAPLPVPDPERLPGVDVLSRNPAVALFVERVAAVKPDFAVTPDNAAAVAGICARLDGLPLAIELAAARIKLLPVASMLARLKTRLEVLTGGARDLPARQQTLRQTIDWSYGLLSQAQQKLFRRLSVFQGGCTMEGAEAVSNAHRDLGIEVLDGMAALLDHSLLQRVDEEAGEVRFIMLETIREYGLERIVSNGEEEETRRAHAAYCLVLAEEGNTHPAGVEQETWLDLCEGEHDNLRASLAWLLERQHAEWALRLGQALFGFWEAREYLTEGCESLQAILNLPGSATRNKARASVLWRAGAMLGFQGDFQASRRVHQEALGIYYELGNKTDITFQLNVLGACEMLDRNWEAAQSWYEQSLRLCRELGSRAEIAGALNNLAQVLNAQGDHALASSLLEEALAIFRESGHWSKVGWSFNHLGDIARSRGDLAEARRYYQEGADVFRSRGDAWGLARSFADLAHLACDESDYTTAHPLFAQSIQLFLKLRHKRGVARILEGFACLAARQGDGERALTLAGSAAALRHKTGASSRPGEQPKLDRALEPAWHSDDPAAAKATWISGWRMPLEQAVQYAISPGETPRI